MWLRYTIRSCIAHAKQSDAARLGLSAAQHAQRVRLVEVLQQLQGDAQQVDAGLTQANATLAGTGALGALLQSTEK